MLEHIWSKKKIPTLGSDIPDFPVDENVYQQVTVLIHHRRTPLTNAA